jgi:hypothetical protein
MKSVRLPSGSTYFAHEHNALRSDAAAAAFLHVHQQLGALALGTTPSNNQTVTLDINGTNVAFNAVTGSPTNPGDVKAPGTAAGFVANLEAALQNPTVSTSTFIALSAPNAILVQYLGWGLATGGTTITSFSLNTSTYAPLTSFSVSTTVTSGTWTAQTMQLYIEPGTYYVGTTRVLFLGGSTPTITAPSSHPRIDLVTADSTGTIALVTGTENASPVTPSYPANKLVLAEIYNVVGETALYDNDNQQTGQGYVYNDVRPALAPPYISSASQIASGIVLLDPGSDAQGDVYYWNGSALARLPAGSAGQILSTQGASANPQWISPFGTKLAHKNTQATGSLTQNVHTVVQTLSSIPAVGANASIRIRGHYNGGTNVVIARLTIGGVTIQIGSTNGASDNYFDITVVNRNSQTTNDIYGFKTTSGTVEWAGQASFNANLSSAWTLTLDLDPTAIGSTYTVDFLDVYLIG